MNPDLLICPRVKGIKMKIGTVFQKFKVLLVHILPMIGIYDLFWCPIIVVTEDDCLATGSLFFLDSPLVYLKGKPALPLPLYLHPEKILQPLFLKDSSILPKKYFLSVAIPLF
jgi:hypothetical protein